MYSSNYTSPNSRAWRRLRRNKAAMFGLISIAIAILIALSAHVIAPDHTPNANEQILEIQTESPGFAITMLKMPRKPAPSPTAWWQMWWSGSENPYQFVPIVAHRLTNDTLYIERYAGKGQNPSPQAIPLAELATDKTVADIAANFEAQHLVQKRYWLGTDKFGRDNLSRLILGVRVSLSVGLMAVLISLSIGVTLGSLAGYFRGRVDDAISGLINLFWSIPLLLLVFALVMTLGREFWQIYLAVGLTMWVEVARLVRGQVMSIRERDFVEAARSLGVGHERIIRRHILPNILGLVTVLAAADFASAIIIEAGLSFLGIGVQPPTPSWGTMLNEYYGYIGTDKAFLALIPGAAICWLVLAFNLLGNGLRDALDVQMRA